MFIYFKIKKEREMEKAASCSRRNKCAFFVSAFLLARVLQAAKQRACGRLHEVSPCTAHGADGSSLAFMSSSLSFSNGLSQQRWLAHLRNNDVETAGFPDC